MGILKSKANSSLRTCQSASLLAGLVVLLLSSAAAAQTADVGDAPPKGGTLKEGYINGKVPISLGSGATTEINLFVENLNPYPDGRSAAQVYDDSALLWQKLYEDYIRRGITERNIEVMANSIIGEANSGVYIKAEVSACGYNGHSKTITCGPGVDHYTKSTMAHENMHGWEFQFDDQPAGIQFYMAFANFANIVYHAYSSDPTSLKGTDWEVTYLTYGLQSEAEWGSEVFADWLYDDVDGGVWPYIDAHLPGYENYFDCLWRSDNESTVCAQALELPIEFATSDPTQTPPLVDGFTEDESRAIWNVCFDIFHHGASEQDYAVVDNLVAAVAPDLPDSPARNYNLAYADCNHDDVIDWLCWYGGPGPPDVGNGEYLWNSDYRQGTYTFIVSGKAGDSYAEYKPDPFLTLPSINRSLAQPMYREWQGAYGSCNGANTFVAHNGYQWYPMFSSRIHVAPELHFLGSQCASCDDPVEQGAMRTVDCATTSGASRKNMLFYEPGSASIVANYKTIECSENLAPVPEPTQGCDARPVNGEYLHWLYADTVDGVLENISCNIGGRRDCRTPDLTLVDEGSVADTLSDTGSGIISDLNLSLDITHSWVGDLIVTLEHVESGTSIDVVDRPGTDGSDWGCERPDIMATLDDEAISPVEGACWEGPLVNGNFKPNQALSAFDGKPLGSSWRLTVADPHSPETGTLNEWCLISEVPWVPPPPRSCSQWTTVFRHDSTGGVYFANDEEALSANVSADPATVKKFSRLSELESARGADGKFHFKLVYPDRFQGEWVQSSNPVDTLEAVIDYENVNAPWTTRHWQGLARSNSLETLIDGSVGHPYWFYSIGSNTAWNNAIPGPNGPVASVELQVCGTLPPPPPFHGKVFLDDFESGNTDNWSSSVGEF